MSDQDARCPKCGCQINNPIHWGKVIHDIAECQGIVQTTTSAGSDANSGSCFVDPMVRQILQAYWSQRKNYYLAIPERDRDKVMVNQLAVAELCLEHAQRGSSALRGHLRAAWRDTRTQFGRFRKMMRDLFLPNR